MTAEPDRIDACLRMGRSLYAEEAAFVVTVTSDGRYYVSIDLDGDEECSVEGERLDATVYALECKLREKCRAAAESAGLSVREEA